MCGRRGKILRTTKSERVVSLVNKTVKSFWWKNLQKTDLSSADLFETDDFLIIKCQNFWNKIFLWNLRSELCLVFTNVTSNNSKISDLVIESRFKFFVRFLIFESFRCPNSNAISSSYQTNFFEHVVNYSDSPVFRWRHVTGENFRFHWKFGQIKQK